MGYDAFVRCNCWKEGKTKPYLFDHGFHFKSNGDLAVGRPDEPFDLKKQMTVRKWMEDCCEHPRMEVVFMRVANISGMTAFKETLEQIGWEHFPTLRAELPILNGGTTSADLADAILLELAQFIHFVGSTKTAILVNSETGESVQPYLGSREGVFLHQPHEGVDIGIDLEGFFIAKRYEFHQPITDAVSTSYRIQTPRLDLFRAMRFEQYRVDNTPNTTEFVDLDTGKRFMLPALHNDKTPEVPNGDSIADIIELMHRGSSSSLTSIPEGMQKRTFHVEVGARDPHDFDYTIEALVALCNAAKETGNPICWA